MFVIYYLAKTLIFLLNLTELYPIQKHKVFINEHRNIVYTMSSIIKCDQSTFTEKYELLSSLLQYFLVLIRLTNDKSGNLFYN